MAEYGKRWEEIARKYRIHIKLEKRLSENTVESYMRDLEQFAHFILRMWDVPPRKVEPQMVERYMAWLFDQGREKSSQARILSGLKSFFNYLLLTEAIEASPMEFIQSPKFGRHLPDVLTTDEIDRIIGAIDCSTPKGLRDSAMLEVLYSCGLRVSELVSLRLGDLFFGEGYIRVVGKGDKQRLVPVSDTARDRIYAYLDCRKGARKSEEILFLSNRGRRLTRVMVFKIIRQAVLRAGIDKQVSPHTFRHSFATHLLEGGASIRQVQEMLGHENIVTTEIYTHLNNDHLRETVERYLPLR
ncbi:site-specific tyrosine recombinase XerD [uncultured Alistipes sp.]|uniref:site-specific tyrosine recombinase XerD n=1 Tax=uncultured Alistipes sp. TaxID=538949 RepID=UPI00261A24F4|nr:site-specific tyrosine recombinase XerD [uncultured Alistipes sp.]